MGKFTADDQIRDYESRYCRFCEHRVNKCPVMVAHKLYDHEFLLDLFIPFRKGKNQQCTMFVPEREGESDG